MRPLALAFAVIVGMFAAQAPKTFEVVSIKAAAPTDPMGDFPVPGTLTVGNRTLHQIILEVYRLKTYQLEGGPAWINSDHYNIVGKTTFPATIGQMFPMLIPLLEDRFQLKIHRETREHKQYALVVAKGGPKMALASDKAHGFSNPPGRIIANRMTMAYLANYLSSEVDCPVVNETGLEGEYHFTLTYNENPKPLAPGEIVGAPDPGTAPLAIAIQSLGLRLEARKGPMEVVVIDHVQKPALN